MSPLETYTRNVARRWKVVAAFALIGAGLAVAWSFGTSRTTWTATTALTTQSQERAPDQDAVLALGYVNYFNQAGYQDRLYSEVVIPPGVRLEAQTGATSPIMYITASGHSGQDARDAAALAAETFRQDVRASLLVERRRAADDLQAQVDANVKLLGQRGYNDAVVLDQIRSLQGRITDIEADNTNQLKQLQPEPGLAATTPSRAFGILTGLAGGLVTGILVALLLALVDRRVRTSTDVRQRIGLPTLGELRSAMDAESRRRVAATVVNGLSLVTAECGVVIAVAAPRRSSTTHQVAVELASTAAGRRSGALLVQADVSAGSAADDPMNLGLLDVLDGRSDVQSAVLRASNGLKVLRPGSLHGRDVQGLIEPNRVAETMGGACAIAGVVVVELPPILEAAEAQVLAAAADRVVLVVERGVTLAPDSVAARRTLDSVGATIAGVLIVDPPAQGEVEDEPLAIRRSAPVAVHTHQVEATEIDDVDTVVLRGNGSAGGGTVLKDEVARVLAVVGAGTNDAGASGTGADGMVTDGDSGDDTSKQEPDCNTSGSSGEDSDDVGTRPTRDTQTK